MGDETELLPFLEGLSDDARSRLKDAFGHVLESRDSDLQPRQIRDIEPVRTWLRSHYYNSMARNLYAYWEEEITDFIEGGYNEWVISGSIGTGKSTAALIAATRKLYELSCWELPQRLFRLADTTKIFFAYLSVNLKQAELTGYGQIRESIDSTRYFQEHYVRDSKVDAVLRFPKGVFFIPGSDSISFIGTNLFGCILDEINFMRVNSGTVGDVHKAQQIYQEATDRRRSRFMYRGKDPGFSLLVSSSTVQTSFTASRIKAAQKDRGKTIKVTVAKLWEVKPKDTYSNRVFYVFNGSDQEDAFVIENVKDVLDLVEDPIEAERLRQAARAAAKDLGIRDIETALGAAPGSEIPSAGPPPSSPDQKEATIPVDQGLADRTARILYELGERDEGAPVAFPSLSERVSLEGIGIPYAPYEPRQGERGRKGEAEDCLKRCETRDSKWTGSRWSCAQCQGPLHPLPEGEVRAFKPPTRTPGPTSNTDSSTAPTQPPPAPPPPTPSQKVASTTEPLEEDYLHARASQKEEREIRGEIQRIKLPWGEEEAEGDREESQQEGWQSPEGGGEEAERRPPLGARGEPEGTQRATLSGGGEAETPGGREGVSDPGSQSTIGHGNDPARQPPGDPTGTQVHGSVHQTVHSPDPKRHTQGGESPARTTEGMDVHVPAYVPNLGQWGWLTEPPKGGWVHACHPSSEHPSTGFRAARVAPDRPGDPHQEPVSEQTTLSSEAPAWSLTNPQAGQKVASLGVASCSTFPELMAGKLTDDSFPLMDAIWDYVPVHLQNAISRVPIDFRPSFDGDLYTALKNIAGVSVAPIGKLFTSRALWTRAMEPGLMSPFKRESFTLTLKGPDSIIQHFRVDKFFTKGAPTRHPQEPRYLRVDQSKNQDCTGIACVHRAGWGALTGIREPRIELDFAIKIVPPPRPDKIGFHKVRAFIIALRDLGLRIAHVTFDQYQSEDHQQLLELAHLKTGYLSVDKDDKPYLSVVNLLNEGRLKMYPYDPLKQEFFSLDHDRGAAKVDHPNVNADGTKGSKDVADAVVGAVFDCNSGQDVSSTERMEVLQDLRIMSPTMAKAPYGGAANFDWLVPASLRGRVEIEIQQVGDAYGVEPEPEDEEDK